MPILLNLSTYYIFIAYVCLEQKISFFQRKKKIISLCTRLNCFSETCIVTNISVTFILHYLAYFHFFSWITVHPNQICYHLVTHTLVISVKSILLFINISTSFDPYCTITWKSILRVLFFHERMCSYLFKQYTHYIWQLLLLSLFWIYSFTDTLPFFHYTCKICMSYNLTYCLLLRIRLQI